jgi:carbamate kinase
MIGYLIDRSLSNVLPERQIATLLTQVVVDPADPAFEMPSKPIGPAYRREEAEQIARERGFRVAPDGQSWRRVVPSPEPRRIIELDSIRLLLDAGAIVICAGGGGVPVLQTATGTLAGVEAVIDKDLAAALLGRQLNADALLLLTDVPAIELEWGTAAARPLRTADPAVLRALVLPDGSMGPKAEAAARFAEGGGRAVICSLEAAAAGLAGEAGTQVRPAG